MGRRSHTRWTAGFTLIELMAVMFIIGLTITISAPRVSNLLRMNLRSAGTQVAGYLKAAYEQAVMKHQRIRVRFDFAQNAYWAEVYEDVPSTPLLDTNTKIDEFLQEQRKLESEFGHETEEDLLKARQAHFTKVEGTQLRGKDLPDRIKLKGIYVSTESKTITEGSAAIDFAPGGFAQKAIVYVINSEDEVLSIILDPIGGRTRVEKGETRPDET